MRFIVALLVAVASVRLCPAESRQVVMVVWDGMRPDFVSEQTTPTLWKLAQQGVTFANHHSVFPTATNVNGMALISGVYPDRSGILANHVYRPELDAGKPVDVEAAQVVQKGDQWSAGKYVAVPTLPELIHDTGRSTAIATAKTVGLLMDRHFDPERSKNGVTLFAGNSLPANLATTMVKTLGAFPAAKEGVPSPPDEAAKRDVWTTKALTDFMWHDPLPAFSLLWLGEPDDTEHKTAPGAPPVLDALKASDQCLAAILAALDKRNARSTSDIVVVSDHGFSTIEHKVDLPRILSAAGFNVFTKISAEEKAGDIMMVGNGGSVLFYVAQQDPATTQHLVDFLQKSPFSGVIFTKKRLAGTFQLDQGKIENDTAPDVEMAFRWTDAKNQFDRPGMIDADWQRAAGKGTHATLSRFDLHNILIAAGPDFKKGLTSELPSGNVDVAPTILRVLGIGGPPMDGRVLTEAMVKSSDAAEKPETSTIEATNDFPNGKWRQYLKTTRVGSTIYLDEGNGEFVANKAENK